MTFSSPSARNLLIAVMAIVYTALTFTAIAPGAAMARDNGPYYSVQLAQPAAESTLVAASVGWSCKGTSCVARKSNSRPTIVCKKLAREVGTIASFTANGKPLSAEKLARCNGE